MSLSYPNPSLSNMANESAPGQVGSSKGVFPPKSGSSWRRRLLTAIILSGLMFSCLDTSIVSTALVSISNDLENYKDAAWAILGYLLTYMSFAIGFSRLSDVYGRKNLLAVAWLAFSGFSIWCALATSMWQLIAARSLQGIGGSGLYSLAQVCLVEQGPDKPEIVGALVGISLSISYILGPLLGGAISEWTWRGIFWINLPFGLTAIIGIFTLWPEERRNKYDTKEGLGKIDFLGNLLLVVASILLVFAIQEGASFDWGWSSPPIIWSLVISGISWFLLTVWEYYLFYGRTSKIQPIFPMGLMTNRVYLSSFLVTVLTGFVYIALVIKIPERLQINYGDNALLAGVHLLPMLGSCAFGSFLGGAVSKKHNLTSQALVAGSSLQLIGIGLVFNVARSDYTPVGYIFGFTAIYGLGVGLSFAASTMIAVIEARQGDLAAAQGAVAQARVFGGALGLAICTVLFSIRAQRLIDTERQTPMVALLSPHNLGDAAKEVYRDTFRDQMLMMTVITSISVMVSLFTYKSKPSAVFHVMAYHKEYASRSNNTELGSTSSIRSLVQ